MVGGGGGGGFAGGAGGGAFSGRGEVSGGNEVSQDFFIFLGESHRESEDGCRQKSKLVRNEWRRWVDCAFSVELLHGGGLV